MAARSQPFPVEFVSLRALAPGSLDGLLAQQTEAWNESFDWDFRGSAELIRGFANTQSLEGMAIVLGDEVLGYTYFSIEDRRGLIGDLFVNPDYVRTDLASRLLSRSAEELLKNWNCTRVETQLMLNDPSLLRNSPAFGKPPQCFDRNFMVLTEGKFQLPPRFIEPNIRIEPFRDRLEEEAARLLTECYAGHVDSSINNQYCGVPGARKFLRNIVQYPGCGTFSNAASFGAWDLRRNRLVGLVLASNISEQAGHITQLCVSPRFRGEGLGYELTRQSVQALAIEGATRVSLSVTANNRIAVGLYEHIGFQATKTFLALVWEKPQALHRRFFPF